MSRRTSIAFLTFGIILLSACSELEHGADSSFGPDVELKNGKGKGNSTPDPIPLTANFNGGGAITDGPGVGSYAAEINVGNGDNFRLITGPGGFDGNEGLCVQVSIPDADPPIDDCVDIGFATQEGTFAGLAPLGSSTDRGSFWWPHGDVGQNLRYGASCPAKGNANGGPPRGALTLTAGPDADNSGDPDTYTIETTGQGEALLCVKGSKNSWSFQLVDAPFSITVERP